MDLDALRLPDTPLPTTSAVLIMPAEVPRKRALFLKGPVPLDWLAAAGRLPGKGLQVGLVIWHRAGVARAHTVSVPTALLADFGVDRFAKRRALDALAGAGLISVQHHRGRHPVVTLLSPPAERHHHEDIP